MNKEKQNKTRTGRRRVPEKPAEQIIHFELSRPSATKVCVAGSFNNWNPEVGEMTRLDDGRWVKDLKMHHGTYEYRLVVDGEWMPDPEAEHGVINSFGEKNSLLTVP